MLRGVHGWESENDTQQSFSSRWYGWFDRVERQRSWDESSSRHRRRFGKWVKQAELDEGTRTDGLKTEEREILSKAAAWFAQETEKKSKRSSSS